jgi:hypothetical protein
MVSGRAMETAIELDGVRFRLLAMGDAVCHNRLDGLVDEPMAIRDPSGV